MARTPVLEANSRLEARIAAGWEMSLKKGQRGPRVWRQNEDVALGFWVHPDPAVSRAMRGRQPLASACTAMPVSMANNLRWFSGF